MTSLWTNSWLFCYFRDCLQCCFSNLRQIKHVLQWDCGKKMGSVPSVDGWTTKEGNWEVPVFFFPFFFFCQSGVFWNSQKQWNLCPQTCNMVFQSELTAMCFRIYICVEVQSCRTDLKIGTRYRWWMNESWMVRSTTEANFYINRT